MTKLFQKRSCIKDIKGTENLKRYKVKQKLKIQGGMRRV